MKRLILTFSLSILVSCNTKLDNTYSPIKHECGVFDHQVNFAVKLFSETNPSIEELMLASLAVNHEQPELAKFSNKGCLLLPLDTNHIDFLAPKIKASYTGAIDVTKASLYLSMIKPPELESSICSNISQSILLDFEIENKEFFRLEVTSSLREAPYSDLSIENKIDYQSLGLLDGIQTLDIAIIDKFEQKYSFRSCQAIVDSKLMPLETNIFGEKIIVEPSEVIQFSASESIEVFWSTESNDCERIIESRNPILHNELVFNVEGEYVGWICYRDFAGNLSKALPKRILVTKDQAHIASAVKGLPSSGKVFFNHIGDAKFKVSLAVENKKELESLECKISMIPLSSIPIKDSRFLCISEICKSLSLDEFVTCSKELEFENLNRAHGLNKEYAFKVETRATSRNGSFSNDSLLIINQMPEVTTVDMKNVTIDNQGLVWGGDEQNLYQFLNGYWRKVLSAERIFYFEKNVFIKNANTLSMPESDLNFQVTGVNFDSVSRIFVNDSLGVLISQSTYLVFPGKPPLKIDIPFIPYRLTGDILWNFGNACIIQKNKCTQLDLPRAEYFSYKKIDEYNSYYVSSNGIFHLDAKNIKMKTLYKIDEDVIDARIVENTFQIISPNTIRFFDFIEMSSIEKRSKNEFISFVSGSKYHFLGSDFLAELRGNKMIFTDSYSNSEFSSAYHDNGNIFINGFEIKSGSSSYYPAIYYLKGNDLSINLLPSSHSSVERMSLDSQGKLWLQGFSQTSYLDFKKIKKIGIDTLDTENRKVQVMQDGSIYLTSAQDLVQISNNGIRRLDLSAFGRVNEIFQFGNNLILESLRGIIQLSPALEATILFDKLHKDPVFPYQDAEILIGYLGDDLRIYHRDSSIVEPDIKHFYFKNKSLIVIDEADQVFDYFLKRRLCSVSNYNIIGFEGEIATTFSGSRIYLSTCQIISEDDIWHMSSGLISELGVPTLKIKKKLSLFADNFNHIILDSSNNITSISGTKIRSKSGKVFDLNGIDCNERCSVKIYDDILYIWSTSSIARFELQHEKLDMQLSFDSEETLSLIPFALNEDRGLMFFGKYGTTLINDSSVNFYSMYGPSQILNMSNHFFDLQFVSTQDGFGVIVL